MPNLEFFYKKSIIPNNTVSSELLEAITDETGTGVIVFNNSPNLLGIPTAPTATTGTNSTQIATTAFVQDALSGFSSSTNLSYTASPTNGLVLSDTGTDATIPLADVTNAGLLAPADFTKLSNLSGTNTGDQTITLTGDVTGSGTGSFATTLANTAVTPNSYGSATQVAAFTVDSKGRLTAASNTSISIPASQVSDFDTEVSNNTDVAANTSARHASVTLAGTLDYLTIVGQEITRNAIDLSTDVTGSLPQSAVTNLVTDLSNKQPLDADLTAIAELAGTSGLLRKTAANTWSLDTAVYLTGNETITLSGDATGSGTTAIAVTLSNSGVSAGTYTSVTVDTKGRVTAGTNPTTLSGYGITDALSNSNTSTQSGYFGDIYLYDDSTPSNYLQVTNSANLTAARSLSINVNDADRLIDLNGDLTLANSFTTSGNFAVTLTATGITNITLPTSGTVATTSDNLGAFAATTSAQLVGVISDETGTGSLVFAGSPALTGAPTAPTAVTGTNTTQIATTAFVQQELGSLGGGSGLTPIKITNANSPYAASSGELIQVDASGGAVVITAPASGSDIYFGIVDYGSSISSTNTVTVNRQGSDTFVNGVETSIVLNSANSFAFFSLDSTDTVYQIGPWSDAQDEGSLRETIIVSLGDEDTAIEVGTGIVTFRIPFSLTLEEIKASSNTAPTGANLIIDINQDGTSILSTKLSIDAGEKTSSTATTPAVISTSALVEDSEISFDFDQVGSSVAGAGIKVYLMGTRP